MHSTNGYDVPPAATCDNVGGGGDGSGGGGLHFTTAYKIGNNPLKLI